MLVLTMRLLAALMSLLAVRAIGISAVEHMIADLKTTLT
jgi:hypothetical protein